MTHFDNDKVREIARLARLKINEAQATLYAQELSHIFDWIDQLDEVDTKNQEPLLNISGVAMPMRPDVITQGFEKEKVLSNAPERLENFFAVPKIIED